MTRGTRTIVVMGLIAVGGVVSLAWMAQRYGDVLSRRGGAARPQATTDELPDSDADRLVEAYLRVRSILAGAHDDSPAAAQERGVTLTEALAAHGLAPEQYQELEAMHRAWRSDSPEVPAAYREAFDRRRERLGEAASESEVEGAPADAGI